MFMWIGGKVKIVVIIFGVSVYSPENICSSIFTEVITKKDVICDNGVRTLRLRIKYKYICQ